jgi:predicted nucleotidyltransferase
MVDTEATRARLREHLASEEVVETAYLFGSLARGSEAPRDADVAVVFAPGVAAELMQLLALGHRTELAADFPVDLHDFERLPLNLQHRVIAEGELLVDRDPRRRVTREERILVMYPDFARALDIIRQGELTRLTASAPTATGSDHG